MGARKDPSNHRQVDKEVGILDRGGERAQASDTLPSGTQGPGGRTPAEEGLEWRCQPAEEGV